MIEMVIWLVVIAAFVFRALKKNGTLDELFAGAKKRKENKAERVVYEQPEEGSGKKEKKKKGPGIRVPPKPTGLAVTAVVIVLGGSAFLRLLLYSFRGGDGGGHHVRKTGSGGGIRSSL